MWLPFPSLPSVPEYRAECPGVLLSVPEYRRVSRSTVHRCTIFQPGWPLDTSSRRPSGVPPPSASEGRSTQQAKKPGPSVGPHTTTRNPARLEWGSSALNPARLEWGLSALNPARLEWGSSVLNPASLEWGLSALNPASLEWGSSALNPARLEWGSSALNPARLEWGSSALNPARLEWGSRSSKLFLKGFF